MQPTHRADIAILTAMTPLLFGALAIGCGAGDPNRSAPLPAFSGPRAPSGELEGGGPAAPSMADDTQPEASSSQSGAEEGAPAPAQTGFEGSAPPGEMPGAAPAAEIAPEPVAPPGLAIAPVASNASREARNLLGYLYEMYGQKMLSGQMESTWVDGPDYELDYVESVTGKLPAVRGLDFIEWNGVAERAISWWGLGGIANIRWHWGAPTRGQGYEASQEEVDIDRVLTPGTAEHTSMLAGLDRTALELTKLRDANVPVLWTPFHELNGDWFWWGKGTPEQFVRLWRFMFEYFDQAKGLNNLIWVLGYTGQPDADWYPGDDYVDIAGADSYARSDAPQLGMFNAVRSIVGAEMPVSYHECGIIPNPDLAQAEGATWSWFMTWHTGWLTDENTTAHLSAVYAHDFVITLDELPDLR